MALSRPSPATMSHEFLSLHRQGFVRVAACTPRMAVGDPAANAAETLAMMHDGEARNVDLMVFPELGLSAYAIDDLLLQDALLDAGRIRAGAARRRLEGAAPACSCSARRCGATVDSTTAASPCRADGSSASCRSRSFRTIASTTSIAGSRRARACVGLEVDVAGQTVPFGTDLVFAAIGVSRTSSSTSRSARTSGRRRRRRRTARSPAR